MDTILLFGMPGGWELVIIVLVVILLFGAKKIPELAKGLGKGIREFNSAKSSIESEIKDGMKEIDEAPSIHFVSERFLLLLLLTKIFGYFANGVFVLQ